MSQHGKHKVEFICMDEECAKEGQDRCVLSFFVDNGSDTPDEPNYCPYEFDPKDYKYKPWRLLK